jgi:hypothetical protein
VAFYNSLNGDSWFGHSFIPSFSKLSWSTCSFPGTVANAWEVGRSWAAQREVGVRAVCPVQDQDRNEPKLIHKKGSDSDLGVGMKIKRGCDGRDCE